MRIICAMTLLALVGAPAVWAQGFAGDLLSGTLIKPRVGQWAWYDLHDLENNARYVVREAIVDRERVGRETGYWLEIEIIPNAGYKTILKALLTGPASDPKNIHRVLVKYGLDPVQDVSVFDESAVEDPGRARRESMGMEDVVTLSGTIRAERFRVTQGNDVKDIWMNRDVLPTGIVRLRSSKGEWVLRTYGFGGADGQTRLPHGAAPPGDQSGEQNTEEDEE